MSDFDTEEFRRVCGLAQDALRGVLAMLEPDQGTQLRQAYGELKALASGEIDESPVAEERKEQERREEEVRRSRWKKLTFYEREQYIFEHLGDEQLTVGELCGRMAHSMKPEFTIHESMVRSQVTRMFKAAQLQRDGEPWHGQMRYRYYRRRGLSGPIADLQAQFEDSEDEKTEDE